MVLFMYSNSNNDRNMGNREGPGSAKARRYRIALRQ